MQDNRVGADAWRRTGVATFDGNLKRGPRVTYQRIKELLQERYATKFSYGAIVQLSVVRTKEGDLQKDTGEQPIYIKCKGARKGFNVRLNIDAHWSAAIYKGLDHI